MILILGNSIDLLINGKKIILRVIFIYAPILNKSNYYDYPLINIFFDFYHFLIFFNDLLWLVIFWLNLY